MFGEESQEDSVVIRRVGGLEDRRGVDVGIGSVIRRVGGLEGHGMAFTCFHVVIRRVGGLEVISSVHH